MSSTVDPATVLMTKRRGEENLTGGPFPSLRILGRETSKKAIKEAIGRKSFNTEGCDSLGRR